MRGRYVRKSDKQRKAEAFHVRGSLDGLSLPPNDYNVAPSTSQPVIREGKDTGERELVLMRWGQIPFFNKSLSDVKGISTINARRSRYRPAGRGVSLSRNGGAWFRPPRFTSGPRTLPPSNSRSLSPVTDLPLFASGGLWDAWKDEQGHWVQSFSIVTTEANEVMATVHSRMPVILHPRDYGRWLSREVTDQPPMDLLRPLPSEEMEMSPANRLVGNVKNNGPEMLNSA